MNKVKTICPSPPGFYSLRHTQFWSTWTLHTLGHSHVLIYISYVKLWTSGTPQIQDLCKNLNLHIIMLLHNKYCCTTNIAAFLLLILEKNIFIWFPLYCNLLVPPPHYGGSTKAESPLPKNYTAKFGSIWLSFSREAENGEKKLIMMDAWHRVTLKAHLDVGHIS